MENRLESRELVNKNRKSSGNATVKPLKQNNNVSAGKIKTRVFFHKTIHRKGVKTEQESPILDESGKEFVPITSESLPSISNKLDRFALESRLVLIVLDERFAKPDLTFDVVKGILHPVIGHLKPDCFFLRSDPIQRTPKNQAYVICPRGLSEEELIEKACDRNILYGIMTISCIINSLKKETLFIKYGDNNKSGSLETLPREKMDRKTKKSDFGGDNLSKTSNNIKKGSFETLLREKVERDTKESDFVSDILPELTDLGNVVLRVDNLPADLSISTLNLALGCHTIKHKQVIGFRLKQKDVIGAYIVARSDSYETDKILGLHDLEMPNKMRLQIKKTTFKILESHLAREHKEVFRLKDDRISPSNVVGYGNKGG